MRLIHSFFDQYTTDYPTIQLSSFFDDTDCQQQLAHRYSFYGGHSEEVPPVPIPNTVVKLFCADGTAWVTVWESRTPPFLISKAPVTLINIMVTGAFSVRKGPVEEKLSVN